MKRNVFDLSQPELCVVLQDRTCDGKVSVWCLEKPIRAAQAGRKGGSAEVAGRLVQRWVWQFYHQLVQSNITRFYFSAKCSIPL